MPSEIEDLGEKTMFASARVPAWHHLGKVIDHCMTWKEAIVEANINWTVTKWPFRHPIYPDKKINHYCIIRDDNHEILGYVGEPYTPIQNANQFEFIDALLGKMGAHYETAGGIKNGCRVFVCAKVESDFHIKGTDDLHKSYLLCCSSHDGRMRMIAMVTTVRVVCQNTLQLALEKGIRDALMIRHTSSAAKKLKSAESLMKDIKVTVSTLQDKLEFLAGRLMTIETMEDFVQEIFPIKKNNDVSDRAKKRMTEILALYESNDNNAIPEVKGTAYNMLNAVTEFFDFYKVPFLLAENRNFSDEVARADVAVFGCDSYAKVKAMDTLVKVCKNNPLNPLGKTYSIPGNPNLN